MNCGNALPCVSGQSQEHQAYNDKFEPELAVLYVHTPTGQITWHLHPDGLDLFGHVPWADGDAPLFTAFDGHSKDEALARLRRLTKTGVVQCPSSRS